MKSLIVLSFLVQGLLVQSYPQDGAILQLLMGDEAVSEPPNCLTDGTFDDGSLWQGWSVGINGVVKMIQLS